MSLLKKLKEQFNTKTQLIKRLLEVIEYKQGNDILADKIIENQRNFIQRLADELEFVYKDNEELRDKNLSYDSGNKDPEMIKRKKSKQNNIWDSVSVGGGKIKEVRLQDYEDIQYRTYKDYESTAPSIQLDDILKICRTDLQRTVAKFYYDPTIKESYGSYQGTANYVYPGDSKGRQKVYSIIKSIETIRLDD